MSMLETIELFVAVIVALIMMVVLYAANYIQAFTSPWIVLIAIVLLGAGKIYSAYKGDKPAMFSYWNIAYGVLLLIASFFLSYTDVDKANWGTYIIIIAALIDVAVAAYELTVVRKLALAMYPVVLLDSRDEKKESDNDREARIARNKVNRPILSKIYTGETTSFVLCAAGDLLLICSFIYAYSQT